MKLSFPVESIPSDRQVQALGRMFHLLPPAPGDAPISENRKHLALMGREAIRRLSEDQPQLYDELVAALDQAGAFQQRADRLVRSLVGGRQPSGPVRFMVDDNAVLDVAGDLLADPKVWQALVAPSLAERIRGWAAALLRAEPPRRPVPEYKIGSMIWDRRAARQAFVTSMQSWAMALRDSPREYALQAMEHEHAIHSRRELMAGGVAAMGVLGSMGSLLALAATGGSAAAVAEATVQGKLAIMEPLTLGPVALGFAPASLTAALASGAAIGIAAVTATVRAAGRAEDSRQRREVAEEAMDQLMRPVDERENTIGMGR